MKKILQETARKLTELVISAESKNGITYIVNIGNRVQCDSIEFFIHLSSDIAVCIVITIGEQDSDIVIAQKMSKIISIINGKINPFEE
ncbi:hypothetical protein MKC54_03055 [[Clostridium] innocuum]|nr:hypothetical protein [[Clostridium] innocuum]MCR0575853.1 hypothetical protein [[Clostridium] innocuum]